MDKNAMRRALELHQKYPVADLHIDFLLTNYLFGYDISKRHGNYFPFSPFVYHADIPRLKEANVRIVGAGLVCTPLKFLENRRYYQIAAQLEYLKKVCEKHPRELAMVSKKDDFRIALENGAVTIIPGVEGSHSLCGNIDLLETYYDMGARYWTMAHFTGNEACNCPKGIYNYNKPGLTDFGKDLIERVHALGMILDLAHTERQAFLEAAKMSQKPVIVSHTGVSGAYKHWRNIDDEQLEAEAKTDGVVGIKVAPKFLGGSKFRPLSDVADHIIHVVKTIGPDHVSFGSDLDGWIPTMPKGFSDVRDLSKITATLLEKGLPEADLEKILHKNVVRVINKCLI